MAWPRIHWIFTSNKISNKRADFSKDHEELIMGKLGLVLDKCILVKGVPLERESGGTP